MKHFYNEEQFGENWFEYNDVYSSFVKQCANNGHIVEVGCWKGKSSAFMAVEIINSKKTIKFDCVDTWSGTKDDEYHQKVVNQTNNKLYDIFIKNIAPVKHIINPIILSSIKASSMYRDDSLDIVFIDADHSYNAVLEDIKHWLPKVKIAGILAGHDYNSKFHPGVKKAVDKIFNTNFIVQNLCWIHHKNAS